MHIHILGICGTFMAGIAAIAKASGYRVTGSDQNVYPPMSTQLKRLHIELIEGFDPQQLEPVPDCVVVGNAMSRGNPVVEAILDRGIRYASGPQWLAEHVLRDRHVLAVAGTHGKTTTASMLAWILEDAGLAPGFLIGGMPRNFEDSARLGKSEFFVIEADEYDTAFFDKRAKFVHYRPSTLVLNNLEYDHADIYRDIDAILWQFHQLLRIVPSSGRIIFNGNDDNLRRAIDMGCWTPLESFGIGGDFDWVAEFLDAAERHIRVANGGETGDGLWQLSGSHNLENALAAVAASRSAGVSVASAVDSLSRFAGVKRRMEKTATVADITIFDDFAHHPTAIRRTIESMRKRSPKQRIVVAIEPRSNTMKMGCHNEELAGALSQSDLIALYRPADFGAAFDAALAPLGDRLQLYDDYGELVAGLALNLLPGDQLVFMSNGGFGAVRQKLTMALNEQRQLKAGT